MLVAYHRIDAAEVPDEEVNKPTDQIAHRDPCAAIRPEDDDLLRGLAAAAPSKLLITSRLIPRVLLNPASQPIPGVLRVSLPGLRPADAETLLRSCGITGDLAGNPELPQEPLRLPPACHRRPRRSHQRYLPDRGNFDAWVADPAGGGQLNLANLDLVQKRNHILKAALDALPEESRQLLSTLALLSEAVDYPTLSAFNPHLPPEPEEVEEPEDPEKLGRGGNECPTPTRSRRSRSIKPPSSAERNTNKPSRPGANHRNSSRPRRSWQTPSVIWSAGACCNTIITPNATTSIPLSAGSPPGDYDRRRETATASAWWITSLSAPTVPTSEAETLEDLRDGLHVVRTLLKMGRYQQALSAYTDDLAHALLFNLEARAEVLSLLRPFFPQGWAILPDAVDDRSRAFLANEATFALLKTGESKEGLASSGAALLICLANTDWKSMRTTLGNISGALADQNRLAKEERCLLLALDLAALTDDKNDVFVARLLRLNQLVVVGQWAEAEAMWQLLDPMGRHWSRATYRPGDAEFVYARFEFRKGDLREEHLARAEQLAKAGKSRGAFRSLHHLRGRWRLEQGQWALAAHSLHEAVSMARAAGISDAEAETSLAIARFHLRQLADPRREAEQLANATQPAYLALADLWLAIGDHGQAKKHALAAHKWAWADGEPYVRRYELNKARALLETLGADIPKLPDYDPVKDEKLPWEDEVAAAIEKLRAEKEAKNRKKD